MYMTLTATNEHIYTGTIIRVGELCTMHWT